MNYLYIPEPTSMGIFLSYKCTSRCKHCMYACSPEWKADWISEEAIEKILSRLTPKIQASPYGKDKVGINVGFHLTGGEPFLNFKLLLKLTQIVTELDIPSTFVETNCFWCVNDKTTEEKLSQLKEAGLKGILISVNPFPIEEIPFERIERAVKISQKTFGGNVMVYQEFFYKQYKALQIKSKLSFEGYLQKAGIRTLQYIELLPIGRVPFQLGHLYRRYPAKNFFGQSCKEELTRSWHVHVDNYFNYIVGYCGGISLGDGRDIDSIYRGINLDDHPILKVLTVDLKNLYNFAVEQWGYKECDKGYISKCHLCVDIRKHIAVQTDQFKELQPKEFYKHLSE